LIDARSPRQSPFGAHIIKKQKQRGAACESCGEPDHERDADIYLCDDNERSESRTVRGDEGIEKVLIPGITVLPSEFEETVQFIRLCIPVIAKEETDTQIHTGQNEKPLPFSYQLFAHRFFGDRVRELRISDCGMRIVAATSEIIFFILICYSILALVVSCVENDDDIGPVQFLVCAEKRYALN
jgi:hypothetical protein